MYDQYNDKVLISTKHKHTLQISLAYETTV